MLTKLWSATTWPGLIFLPNYVSICYIPRCPLTYLANETRLVMKDQMAWEIIVLWSVN